MDIIRITGGIPLHGKIEISGAKNAALPLMATSILTDETVTLSNIPHLADITTMAGLLVHLGVSLTVDGSYENGIGRVLMLNAKNITDTTAPYDIVRKMRASVLVLGATLTRFGSVKVSLPGGCAIGSRPIDFHLNALREMGATINLHEGYIEALAPDGLKGTVIEFPIVSVGATENIIMAATLAKGTTVIKNAAIEPEIGDLIKCLNSMGANITGTNPITINGVDRLTGTNHSVISDRIEAGTYAIAAAITGGEIDLVGIKADIMESVISKLQEANVTITETTDGLKVSANNTLKPINISTAPYPYFPTDMQAQMTALMLKASGKSQITENIFENRFMHIAELKRMGADIKEYGKTITVTGVDKLYGAEVMATDLRASVSLVLAGMAAHGETIINRVYHIDRGYERIEEKLAACGAEIERIKSI